MVRLYIPVLLWKNEVLIDDRNETFHLLLHRYTRHPLMEVMNHSLPALFWFRLSNGLCESSHPNPPPYHALNTSFTWYPPNPDMSDRSTRYITLPILVNPNKLRFEIFIYFTLIVYSSLTSKLSQRNSNAHQRVEEMQKDAIQKRLRVFRDSSQPVYLLRWSALRGL